MKKLALFLGFLLIPSFAHATILVQNSYQSGADVTINALQQDNTNLTNWANGNVEGGINIKAGSINTSDLAASVSPIQRWSESFNNYTASGMLPATSANLASDISAGVSYVSGYRVETAATNHTYTASKDTYVYIHKGSYFVYQEVANGASAPSTPADTLLLAKVVTSGTLISSVSDLRTLTINITATTSNFPSDYRDGAYVSIDSTTACHIEPGSVAIGTTIYTTTSDTSSRSTATAGNWIEGSAPNVKNLKFYVYAYNNSGSQFDFKYSSADPTASDSSSGTGGTLRYYTTGGTTYRALAWISGDTSAAIVGSGMGQFKDTSNQNSVTLVRRDTVTGTTALPHDNTIPTPTEGDEYFAVPFKLSNTNHKVHIEGRIILANGAATLGGIAMFKDGGQCFYAIPFQATATDRPCSVQIDTYTTLPNTNLTIFRLRAGFDSGTTTLNGAGGAALMGGVIDSRLTITEVEG